MLEKFQNELTDNLFEAILKLKNLEECYQFFDDIGTIKEVQDLAQRLEVAKRLREKMPYNEIAKKTGASTATISRVNKCLAYGSGGYDLILDRLNGAKK